MRLQASLAVSALVVCFYLATWVFPVLVGVTVGDIFLVKRLILISGTGFLVFFMLYSSLKKHELQKMDGFLVVGMTWVLISLISALPFYWALPAGEVRIIDMWLESVSALTTTGVECIDRVSAWPISLLWYRQQLEWVGGVGIIIMMMSLLTLHEGTALSIYNSEFGRDVRDVRITPRLASTARYVCYIYGSLWFVCSLSYYFTGVPWVYAMMESMATVSTGGFSLDDIVPIYDMPSRQWVAIIFMLLGATGFHTHFQAIRGRTLRCYVQQTEPRMLLVALSVVVLTVFFLTLNEENTYDVSMIIFEVAAFVTTTGFETEIHTTSPFVLVVFALLGIGGACCGSTSGGLKLVRVHVLFQEAKGLLMRLLYPNIVHTLAVNGKALSTAYVANVRGYIALFVLTFFFSILILLLLGVPLAQSFYLLCATITNVGGSVGPLEVEQLTQLQKFVLSIVMILGRLEIAALLVLCLPRYWRSS